MEIGPGAGALTRRLGEEAGAVRAVEIDRDMAARLRARLPDVEVICADALTVDLAALLGEGGWRVVGNLPYNVATPLLDRFFDVAARWADLHVMLQAEVAARLSAAPGGKAYGRLSVIAQHRCHVTPLFDVEAESFRPPPKVRSTFARLTPREPPPDDAAGLRDLLRLCFAKRRKTLGNALRSLAPDWEALDIDASRRPETLRVAEFAALARHCAHRIQGGPNG